MKKLLILLAILFLVACGSDESQPEPETDEQPEEQEQLETEDTESPVEGEQEEETFDETEEPDLKTEAEANAAEHTAKPGKKLYDEEFKGMNYHFKGELVKTELVEGLLGEMMDAFLVKNENDFVLVIFPPYEIEANVGDEIEAWGPLSGDGYASSDLGVDNVVGVTGAMNAAVIKVNGEMK